jgi:hypothetical protein
MSLYEKFKKYELPAESIEDFCNKYHRRDAYHERGAEYMAVDLQSHIEEFEKYGYTIIPGSSTTTGDIISYYGKETK